MGFPNQLMLFISFLGFFCFHSAAQQQDAVQQVCSNVKNVDPNFCTDLFAPYPKEKKDDLKKLYSIILTLSLSKATDTSSFIGNLLKNPTNAALNKALSTCNNIFQNSITHLQTCISALAAGDINTLAIHGLMFGGNTRTCNNAFSEQNISNAPLAARNNQILQLTAVSDVTLRLIRGLQPN